MIALLRRVRMPRPMMAFWLLMLAMTGLSVVYTLTTTYVLHAPFPYGAPLFTADDRWFDFTIYHDRFMHFREAGFWDAYEYPYTYPGPLGVVYGVLYQLPHALRYYLLTYAAMVVALGVMFSRKLRERGVGRGAAIAFVATLALFNFPLRVLFESANTEGIVALLAGFGIWAVLKDKCWLGAALIAVAGTMKVFPFIFLALLLSKKKYREFVWGIAVAAVVSVAGLKILGPTVAEAQRHIDDGIRYVKYTFIFAMNPAATTFNHSLFKAVRYAVVGIVHPHDLRALLDRTFAVYLVVVAVAGMVAYFGWMRKLPMLNQVLALTACGVLLPPLSADYTLLHLLLPFGLLCLYAAENGSVPGLTSCLMWFAPVFSFQTYMTWRYRWSGEFRTLGLVALIVVAMRYRFWWGVVDSEVGIGGQATTTN